MHMYDARKNVRENRAITHILKGEMRFATETRLERDNDSTQMHRAPARALFKLKEAAFEPPLPSLECFYWQAYMMPSPPLTKLPGSQPMPLRPA